MNKLKVSKRVGKKIKKARLAVGLSQAQLAKFVGLHQVSISLVEAGKRTLSFYQMIYVTRALKKPFTYFYER